jgi:peptidoglycan-N-acetylglucosamine deacetylase
VKHLLPRVILGVAPTSRLFPRAVGLILLTLTVVSQNPQTAGSTSIPEIPHSDRAEIQPTPSMVPLELPPLEPAEYLPEVPEEAIVEIPAQFRGTTLYRATIPNNQKVIALTFDDGPWPDSMRILDILREYQVKATFFWLGQNVPKYPEIARRVVTEGHAIGNHSWSHPYRNLDAATAAAEVENTAARILRDTGIQTTLFRPPGGFLNNGVATYAQQKNYVIVMWSIDTKDYTQPTPRAMADQVLRQSHPGAIVLMHDGGGNRRNTADALPLMIDGLRQQGYRFVTIPELLAIQAGLMN